MPQKKKNRKKEQQKDTRTLKGPKKEEKQRLIRIDID